MRPLTFRLPLQERLPSESGVGFISRTLIKNHLTWSWLRAATNMKPDSVPTSAQYPVLRHIFGDHLKHESLLSRSRMDDGKLSWMLYGQAFIHQSQLQFKHPKVCGQCLIQTGIAKASWDIDFVTVCSIHRILLSDKCLTCTRKISWSRTSLQFCRCGSPFISNGDLPHDDEVLWAAMLEDRLNNLAIRIDGQMLNTLIDLPLGVLVQLVKIFGYASAGTKSANLGVSLKRYSFSRNRVLLVAGLSGLREVLEGCRPSWIRENAPAVHLRLTQLLDFVSTVESHAMLMHIFSLCFQSPPPATRGRFTAQYTFKF